MDITSFFFSQREDVLLTGDYNGYRLHASRKLHKFHKKLGRTTPKGRKYTPKAPVSAEDVGSNVVFVYVLLLCAERAWAQAMHMKSTSSADPLLKGARGATRSHIISRLSKATSYAGQLVAVLKDQSTSGATDIDILEAHAYFASLTGALQLEKHNWEQCLQDYSTVRVIYTALSKDSKMDAFRDLLSGTVDPSLRYAAYQMKIPRSRSVQSLATQFFPASSELRLEVEKIDPSCLAEEIVGTRQISEGGVQQLPDKIDWRSRTVSLEDSSISQAITATTEAESYLTSWLASSAGQSASAKEKAAAYDSVISASQDAVYATKTAIDDLSNEGVDPSDERMQTLQIIRTAVNYVLVSWRVGRNRILCGERDGIIFDEPHSETVVSAKMGKWRNERSGKKLAKLRERVLLYDLTLQSLEFVLELPGVAADSAFVQELEAKRSYFRSLRCLAIGRSYGLLRNVKEALALFSLALELVDSATSVQPSADVEAPPKLDVSYGQIQILRSALQGLVAKYMGLAALEGMLMDGPSKPAGAHPVIEQLHEYNPDKLDLSNLVPYPPQIQPIPVKPLFLDVAWNYIDYPREPTALPRQSQLDKENEENKGQRRGWFGFGR